jgi:hypothetical protein
MRTFVTWGMVGLVLAVFGPVARSEEQPEQSVPEGATVKLLLLRQKSVQKELNVSPETAEKVQAFTQGQSDAAKKALGLDKGERKEAFEKLAKQNEKFLADNLTAKQSKRLGQIAMQFTALTQLTKPEMVKELKLSDEQVSKFKDLQKEARKGLLAIINAKESEGRSEKLKKLHMDTRTKILDVLTDDQKTKVRELAGEPFEGEIVFEEEP